MVYGREIDHVLWPILDNIIGYLETINSQNNKVLNDMKSIRDIKQAILSSQQESFSITQKNLLYNLLKIQRQAYRVLGLDSKELDKTIEAVTPNSLIFMTEDD